MKEHERWSEEIERERGREEAGGEREVVGEWGTGGGCSRPREYEQVQQGK